jgi:hypothetical protein
MADMLIPHDRASEVFVCRDCMVRIDPVNETYPGYTKADCDQAKCPHCGGTDTRWLFASDDGPIPSGTERVSLVVDHDAFFALIVSKAKRVESE